MFQFYFKTENIRKSEVFYSLDYKHGSIQTWELMVKCQCQKMWLSCPGLLKKDLGIRDFLLLYQHISDYLHFIQNIFSPVSYQLDNIFNVSAWSAQAKLRRPINSMPVRSELDVS
jgi:hypothetical protein